MKLGVLLLATGGCLIAGRSLKATLPATAGALLHLGTFLVPIDVAAIGIHADLDWSTLLLAEGMIAAATFGWAAITERSVVLRSAFAVSVVALAGGIGATTALPAPLVLAAFAAAALGVAPRRPGHRLGRAGGRGSAAHLRRPLAFTGADTVERLGLTGEQPRLAAVLTGATAAVVLAVAGRRRSDAGLVLVGVALGAIGTIASWSGQDIEPTDTLVGLAAVFLLVQLVAYAVRDDHFWSVPAGIVAHIVEWFAGLATLAAVLPILFAPASDTTSTETALATLVLGAGWLVADRRRGSRGFVLAAVAAAICVASAVASATASDPVLALTLTAIAGLAVLSDHRAGSTVAVLAASWAPVVAIDSTGTLVAVGVAGTLVLAEAAVRRSNAPSADEQAADVAEQWAWLLSAVALVPGAIAMGVFIGQTGHVVAGLIGGAVTATAAAIVLDRGRVTGALPLGTLARIGSVAVLAGAAELSAAQLAVVALAVSALVDPRCPAPPRSARRPRCIAGGPGRHRSARPHGRAVRPRLRRRALDQRRRAGRAGLPGRPPLVAADPRRRCRGLRRRSRARRPRRQRLRRRRDDHQWDRARGVGRAGPPRRRPPRFAGHDGWHVAPSRRRRDHRQRAVPVPGRSAAHRRRAAGPLHRCEQLDRLRTGRRRSSAAPPSPSG